MADFDPFDLDDTYEYFDDDNLDAEWDLEPEPELLPNPPEPLKAPTDDETEFNAVLAVIQCLNENNIKMDQFLDALCWGNKKCVGNPVLKEARRQLIKSKRLPTILDHMHTPINYTGECPKAAAAALNCWAWRHVTQLARHELNEMAKDAHVNRADDNTVNFPDRDYIKFNVLKDRTSLLTPGLVRFLTLTSETKPRARARLNQDNLGFLSIDPSFAAVMNIYSLVYQYAPRCNRLQKHLSLYFRAKHAPKSLYSLFNKCGYSLSYTWANDTVATLAAEALARMKDTVKNHAVFWIYDNLRLATPIKAQRGDRHTITDNGTTMTVVQLPDEVKEIFFKNMPADAEGDNPVLGSPAPTLPSNLSPDDFLDFERFERLVNYEVYLIHSILFETVPGLADLEVRSDGKLCPPVPLHTMPWGGEHKTHYHMLGTVPIDESSIGGNLQVIAEIIHQTDLDSDADKKSLGMGFRTIPIVGDQMTASRLRALLTLRSRDPNGFERLSWIIIVPPWFHILLNLGMSTFDGHRGSDQTMTFYKDLSLLGRSGLNMNMRQKRPDFFTNDEFLRHKLFALIRSLWMHYSSTRTVDELVEWVKSSSAVQLAEMARRIHSERVSSRALEQLASEPEPDEVLHNTIFQSRDLLQYYSVRRGIQTGNVGWLEDLLPNLIIYFRGRENNNYAQELAEVMQWMRHEASPEMRHVFSLYCHCYKLTHCWFSAAIRDHAWLVNTSGRKNGFYECDRLQEFNNDRQKRFGPPPQTTSWETHKEIAPAIPILGEIAEHIEDNLFDFRRTRVHKETSAELDISRLASRHLSSSIHTYTPDRKIEVESDLAQDYVQLGIQSLSNTNWLATLAEHRAQILENRSTEQVYSLAEPPPLEIPPNQEQGRDLDNGSPHPNPDLEME